MRDKVLTYAIGISLIFHLVAVCVVGRTFATRLSAAPAVASIPRFLKVDLVRTLDEPLQPKPEPIRPPEPVVHQPNPITPDTPTPQYMPRSSRDMRPAPNTGRSPYRMPGNPGGTLNTGTPSRNGDLPGFGGGTTRVGTVPGDRPGLGSGTGTGHGVSPQDPPRHADPGPGDRSAIAQPPPRRSVSVKVCEVSGMLAGEYCKRVETRSFLDGDEPRRTCNVCKAPEPEPKSRLADRANPELVRDSRPSIPDSVDEGLDVSVTVEYTVTADGNVTGVDVTRSSGNRAIDRAVISAASNLRYKPAVQDGTPRSVKMTRTYRVRT